VTASALAAVEGAAAADTGLHQQQHKLTVLKLAETDLDHAARLAGRV
jgi:hypothetical protein|tara:strand:+ start:1066 stop:1206 length:141 start_codon:yes stop_codon:yes gene_type:complete